MYPFLWDVPLDKINKVQCSKRYLAGGLNMINMYNHVKNPTINWTRILIVNSEGNWVKLFEATVASASKVCKIGSQWLKIV